MKPKLLILLFLGIFSLQAQVRIKLVDPSTNSVTLHNYGGSTVNVSSYWFCNFPSYAQISTMTVNSGSLSLASGAEVNITSSVNFGTTDGELGLYTTNASSFADDMIDYLQWGAFGHQRENVANAAGIWTTGTFISDSPPFEYTGNGSDNGVSNWGTVLSIEDFKNDLKFSIHPNPTNSILNLSFQKIIDKGSVRIYSILERNILNQEFSFNNNLKINISNLSKGLYLVKVNNQTNRFIKQ